MRTCLTVIMVLFFFWQCTERKNINNDFCEVFVPDLVEDDGFTTNGVPDSCDFIKLESNDSILINFIAEIQFADSLIFIEDAGSINGSRLLIFDSKGNFKYKIDESGRENPPLSDISEFYIDEVNYRIGIYNAIEECISEVSYDGKIERVIPLEKIREENVGLRSIERVSLVDQSTLLFLCNSDRDGYDMRAYFIDREDVRVKDTQIENFCNHGVLIASINKFLRAGNNIYLIAHMNDTLYRYRSDLGIFYPELVAKIEKESLSKEKISEINSMIDRGKADFRHFQPFSMGIGTVYYTDSHVLLYTDLNEKQEMYRVLYNYNTGKISKTTLKITDAPKSYRPLTFIGATNEGFVCPIPAYQLLEDRNDAFVQNHVQLQRIIANTTDADNPIIAIFYHS